MKHVLVNGDCIKLLSKIKSKSVDLILTDPPYNLDFSKYDNCTDKGGRKFHYTEKLKWDKKESINMKEMSNFLFNEFDRILKESGSIIIFGPQEWAYYYYEPAIKNNFDLKCQIIWIKSNPIPQIRRKNYRSTHENIVWFARYDEKKCPYIFNFTHQQDMRNVFEYPILGGKERIRDEDNKATHPTQKPLKLIRKLVKIHSNEGDLVLDPFAGSFTTSKACYDLDRNSISIEINPEYFNLIGNRFSQTKLGQQHKIFKVKEDDPILNKLLGGENEKTSNQHITE